MIDTLAGLDWIGPSWTLYQDWRNRPARNFMSYQTEYPYLVRNLLQEVGIKVWGISVYGDQLLWSTREAQARYALYILDREGISCISRPAFSLFAKWE